MNRQEKRASRCLSLQIYYAWIISETHPREILDYISNLQSSKEEVFFFDINNANNSKLVLSKDIMDYTYRLIESTIKKSDEVDDCITSKLKNWDLKRIALIDKLILRLSITEMFFFDEVPPKVSIVEGVEIGKIFGNSDSSAFINGVLDSIYNDLEEKKAINTK
jgi:N utilization substance protein B